LKSFDDILNALRVNLTAYRPSEYIKDLKVESVLENPKQREKFLVKMMYMLLMKRLESSWFSFKSTVENILNHHVNALTKVDVFIQLKVDAELEENFTEEEQDEIEDTASENSEAEEQPITLGKKNPIPLSSITNIDVFRKHLEADVVKLKKLKSNLDVYEKAYKAGDASDDKLDKLIEHIQLKQKSKNKKILIFTVFKDTAKFLYDELNRKGFENIAFVSGSISETNDGYTGNKFEPILERFAPFTKLYNEKDWSMLYVNAKLGDEFKSGERWNVPFEKWLELIKKYDKPTFKKIDNPIDILIATDCLSEGQNLQDCDTVVNYDIHWNPVRLIQRMGRIDRLGSPNKIINGINFWPGKNYEDYLSLKSRVENRMALMSVVGTELDDKLTPEFERMVEENPLLPKQAQKMLQQLQITWDDIETNDETLGLNDLSLEQFRQELFEFFKKNEEFFQKIPNGVYSGFKFRPNKKWREMPDSVVAVLGYPRRPDEAKNHVYDEIHLIHNATNEKAKKELILNNNQEILAFLKWHKMETRYVPKSIEQGDTIVLNHLANSIGKWIESQAAPVSVNQIQDLFSGNFAPQKISPTQKKLEDKYKKDNFDLINWFVISNK
ncbi:MAG: C-terminal helicase domain-containing protein, partial [Paludibacter sp.]